MGHTGDWGSAIDATGVFECLRTAFLNVCVCVCVYLCVCVQCVCNV